MSRFVRFFRQYRELLLAFTIRNIQVKYKQTFFGFLWAIFMPAVIVLSGVIVKLVMSKISGKPILPGEILSISVKALPWAFFLGSLRFAVGSLVSNMHILQKVNFPRVVFPLSYTISQLFDFCVAIGAFAVLWVMMRTPASLYLLWTPVMIVIVFLFTAGWGMILSAGNLYYRDVKHIVDVILTFAIFFTPVFFDANLLGHGMTYYALMFNPMGAMLETINRVVVLRQAPEAAWFLYSAGWGIGSFVLGWYVFHKVEPTFAENV